MVIPGQLRVLQVEPVTIVLQITNQTKVGALLNHVEETKLDNGRYSYTI